MRKKTLILLITLMSVSLIGIIIIQSFFLVGIYKDNEDQFNSNVNTALSEGITWLEKREFRRYVVKFRDLISSGATIDTTAINSLYIIKEYADNDEVMMYRNASIEENLKVPQFWNVLEDSLSLKRISSEREMKILKIQDDNEVSGISSEQFFSKIGEISKSKEILFETAYHDLAKRNSIERRIGNVKSLNNFLKYRFKRFNIDIPFEFAIFDRDSLTNVKSENFRLDKNTFESALFTDETDESNYIIKVNMKKRIKILVNGILNSQYLH